MSETEVTIDVLIEGENGELIFKPVKAKPSDIKRLLETKNKTVKYNLEKELKYKKIKI